MTTPAGVRSRRAHLPPPVPHRHRRHRGLGARSRVAGRRRAQGAPLRGGTFPQGVLSGDPTPNGITLLTLLDDVGGAGSVKLEVATDQAFRKVVASQLDRDQRRAQPLGQGAAEGPQAARALLLPLRDT